jgi:hypothetical protein
MSSVIPHPSPNQIKALVSPRILGPNTLPPVLQALSQLPIFRKLSEEAISHVKKFDPF